jgi:hypothetical protein
MQKKIPLSSWASANALTRHQARNLVSAGKIEGAELRRVTLRRWYVPADARPDFTDRRRKDARKRGSPNTRSA